MNASRRRFFAEGTAGLRGLAFACLLLAGGVQALARAQETPPAPQDLWQELFVRVQSARLYPDGKTFADAVPKEAPQAILAAYRAAPPADAASLRDFVAAHFELPDPVGTSPPAPGGSLRQHIAALWPALLRPPLSAPPGSSALPVPFRHVVPGGRFRELYYWDSFFTLLGLVRDGHVDEAREMIEGFAGLITRYGHVPNGTRTYYLSRSQPPVFYLMVGLIEPRDPAAAYARHLASLRAEYAWWMDGAADLARGTAAGHLVRLDDGTLLNRYWDARAAPRDEAWADDTALAQRSGRPAEEVYRELRAAAESGWDFSSRWLADGQHLETIQTTTIVPVDLNSLLYGLEQAIALGCGRAGDTACSVEFQRRAQRRRAAIDTWLWSAADGCYYDYQWRERRATRRLSAATLYPLFVGATTARQAAAVAVTVRRRLLMPGGLATTTIATGQQWDRPNGWAPLQWIGVAGLRARGQRALAADLACRWLGTVQRAYRRERRLLEKYDLDSGAPGSGGEYPAQDGFGWTNGVTRALLGLYPRCQSGEETG